MSVKLRGLTINQTNIIKIVNVYSHKLRDCPISYEITPFCNEDCKLQNDAGFGLYIILHVCIKDNSVSLLRL